MFWHGECQGCLTSADQSKGLNGRRGRWFAQHWNRLLRVMKSLSLWHSPGLYRLDSFLLRPYFQSLLIDKIPVLTVLDILPKAHRFMCTQTATRKSRDSNLRASPARTGVTADSGLQHCSPLVLTWFWPLSFPGDSPHTAQQCQSRFWNMGMMNWTVSSPVLKLICWNPDPQYLRMWQYVESRPLQR